MLEKFLNEKKFLCNILQKEYTDDYKKIIEGYTTNRFTTFRANTSKTTVEEIKNILDENNFKYNVSSFYQNAIILEFMSTSIFNLDIFKEGKIYVQNLSSMLPAILMQPQNNTDILDMTASPGGKTTLISNLAPKSRITAIEKSKIRFEKLKYNITLQGAKNCYPIQQDALKIEDYFKFDNIILDAPCSGTGTVLTSDIDTYSNITEKLISNCSKIQKQLLQKAINITKKGGCITYSTCSILKEENENIIEDFIRNKQVEIIPLTIENIPLLPSKIQGTITVMPTSIYEGFFVCKLRKL